MDNNEKDNYDPFVGYVREKFQQAETSRLQDEKRWLQAYRNYRGLYGPEMAFRDSEKSKVFVKVTKTKVLAAFGQIIEVLFSSGKFPIGVTPTSMPEGASEYAYLDPNKKEQDTQEPKQESPYGFPGDGGELPQGATAESLMKDLAQQYENLGFEEGDAPDLKTQPQIEPAAMAAAKMQKVIHDQLEETDAISVMRHVFFEMALLGTGILKGPFTNVKTQYKFSRDEETGTSAMMEIGKDVPGIEAVSCWDFYPDPNSTSMNDAEYVIQRHSFNTEQFAELAKKPFFNSEKIRECLEMGPNYQTRGYESSLYDRENVASLYKNRFEVLEYWGTITRQLADQLDFEYDDELDVISVNVWICGGKVLRVVENPFSPKRIPYMVCPYELNPYQFFGVGIPENMQDSQQVMNGHARMAIDNLALAGNLVFDVDESALASNQTMEVFPGKIFKRQAGSPGQSIYGLKFPNTAVENMQMFDKFRQLADESTGLPSYSHGQTGVQSMTRTASGMSMLMGAASLNIKTVIKNIDDQLIKPLGEALFQWNMQFYEGDLPIHGDLEIKATGSSSLMKKEVRSQRLTMFLQTVQNPAIAPFVRMSEVIKELAHSLDLDPAEILNTKDEAEIYAKIIGQQNANKGTSPQAPIPGELGAMGGDGGVPPQTPGANNPGNGESPIGPGNTPMPGEMEFTGQTEEPAQ